MFLFSKLVIPRASLLAVIATIILFTALEAFAQVNYPRASQRQAIEQTIGDTQLRIVYHRPNLRNRKAFGAEDSIVPYGRVWRAGANEATVFEFSNDVKVNGKDLPKGKYSFYLIPSESSWTVIFNKSWEQWGTQYDETLDAVRLEVTPVASEVPEETLTYFVGDVTDTSAKIVLAWGKTRVPFTIDLGDVNARVLSLTRREIVNAPVNAANYVLSNAITSSYEEAILWLDSSLLQIETYGALFAKSRLLGELGRKQDAIVAGERALEVGRASGVNPNSLEFLERLIIAWKAEE
ncbi:MAG: DUF2911 domain-containing protein [Acidobacteriota bacterium]|nr:MAG: DUF2911 domain-containing protein [Acidobacteriota bacterium]